MKRRICASASPRRRPDGKPASASHKATSAGQVRSGREEKQDETCRRHRHGDRVVDRQHTPGGGRLAARGEDRASSRADKYAELGFRSQVHGMPTLDALEGRRPPRHALSRRRHRLEPCRHGSGDRRRRPWPKRSLQRAHRHHHGLRRPLDHTSSSTPPISTRTKGPKRVGPFAVPQGHVLDRLGDARRLVQDQGRQLFDLLGLRDVESLHRQRLRTDSVGQAGHDVRRRLRGAGLGALGAVRRDGRHVLVLQRHAGDGLARL